MSLSLYEAYLADAEEYITEVLVDQYGKANTETGKPDPDGQGIPQSAVEDLTEILVSFAANLIQGWLDAGSERDVTYEELEGPIRQHIAGWVPVGNNKSLADTAEYKAERRATALWIATYEGVTPEELAASLRDYARKAAEAEAHSRDFNRQWELHNRGEDTEMFGPGYGAGDVPSSNV